MEFLGAIVLESLNKKPRSKAINDLSIEHFTERSGINPKSWDPLNLLKTIDRENLDLIKRDGLKRGMPLGKGMN